MKKITKRQLIEMIENLDIDDEELSQYLEIDPNSPTAFDVQFRAQGGAILNMTKADKGFLGTLNKRSRRKRQRQYRKKIGKRNFSGIKIVSEGDSWFQYPIFLKDIIDNLSKKDEMAICSLGYGGDWLSNMFHEMEYLRAIRKEKPQVFLISGGGNDLLGDNRLKQLVHPYDSSLDASDYLHEVAQQRLQELKDLFEGIFLNLQTEFPKLQVICHGYDYAIPKKNRWLGKPLREKGIKKRKLQRQIIRELMDRFNDNLRSLSHRFDQVHYVDLRGTLRSGRSWKDELHPRNAGFRKLAAKIEKKIKEVV
ncbi:MAG: SGNH/GDSL hydrolase family protein [Bacteroidota bacterium]